MTATVTDLFCGAGGSSLGAAASGMELVMAANHWATAIEVHQQHFPDAGHDLADISQADPRRYPATDVLIASPECTNHSQARGVSRRRQDPSLWDAPDPSAERSRATMWDVGRFAEQLRYDCIVVENVVEATKWSGWPHWLAWLTDLGYEHVVLSHNSMHHGVPQSRDRIYVVFWRKGLRPDLELELQAHCPRCETVRSVRQAWKPGRTVGRYRQQWTWACVYCGTMCEPATQPAASIIDWTLPCPRIGDRKRPLAKATRARILAGLQRYGWVPITTAGAGHVYETTAGNRARPLSDPLPVQGGTAQHAMATPPAWILRRFTPRGKTGQMMTPVDEALPTVAASGGHFLVQTAHGIDKPSRVRGTDEPTFTITGTGSNGALVVHLRGTDPDQIAASASSTREPVRTVSAGGIHHGLLMANTSNNVPRSTKDPMSTVVAGTPRHALLMRNNRGGAEMVTPASEAARTVTSKGHQSLLVPYNGTGRAKPLDEPLGTQPTRDRSALVDLDQVVDDCGFRMLEPHEISAAMAFPHGYIPQDLTKRDRVKLAGNAVTPPVMAWICGRLLQALEATP